MAVNHTKQKEQRKKGSLHLPEKKGEHFHPFLTMDAFSKHKKLINDYIRYYGGSLNDFKRSNKNDKTDYDVIKENHRFVWEDEDEEDTSWGKSLAKKYYDKLFKEYCISDLSRYKENKFAMRWRTEKEVVEGKGQFICGSRKCEEKDDLQSWEVNFGYLERGMKKNALVKLRLCPNCSDRLNFHQKRRLAERKKSKREESQNQKQKRKKAEKKKKGSKKAKRKANSSDEDLDSGNSEEEKEDVKEETSKTGTNDTESTQTIWSQPAEVSIEKTREEELDDYLDDLFL